MLSLSVPDRIFKDSVFYEKRANIPNDKSVEQTRISIINADCRKTADLMQQKGCNPADFNVSDRQSRGGGVLGYAGGKRLALVIGKGANQRTSELPNPSNDAADMNAAFESLGFKVNDVVSRTDEKTGKRGFVDGSGNEVMPPKYDSAEPFSNGLALVQIRDGQANRNGFVDRSVREAVPVKYEAIWNYMFRDEGIFGVTLDGKKGFVDIYGNEYFDF